MRYAHGTPPGYADDKCRCPECTDAHAEYMRRRRRLMAYRRWDAVVDATEVRKHVAAARAAGHPVTAIAAHAGIRPQSLHTIIEGGNTRRSIHDLLLSFPINSEPQSRSVNACGTIRRIQALSWNGWTFAEIGRASGLPHGTVKWIIGNSSSRVLPATEQAVHEACAQLWTQSPPTAHANVVARTTAHKKGWVSLLAWDDIDDPDEKPKGVEGADTRQHWTATPEQIQDVLRLHGAGLTDAAIARQLGFRSTSAVCKIRSRQRPKEAA